MDRRNAIRSLSDGEKELLDRASGGDASAARSLVERYLKLLFGFSASFAFFSREQAFRITVSSFARTFQKNPGVARDGEWLQALFREGLAECMRTAPLGAEARKEPLKTIGEALVQLSPSDRALLLFRDQCRFSFETIGAIFGMTEERGRSACLTARERLRDAVKRILERPLGGGHGL